MPRALQTGVLCCCLAFPGGLVVQECVLSSWLQGLYCRKLGCVTGWEFLEGRGCHASLRPPGGNSPHSSPPSPARCPGVAVTQPDGPCQPPGGGLCSPPAGKRGWENHRYSQALGTCWSHLLISQTWKLRSREGR